jgi:hypothetical protein
MHVLYITNLGIQSPQNKYFVAKIIRFVLIYQLYRS